MEVDVKTIVEIFPGSAIAGVGVEFIVLEFLAVLLIKVLVGVAVEVGA